jgi:chromosome segregation ATPase
MGAPKPHDEHTAPASTGLKVRTTVARVPAAAAPTAALQAELAQLRARRHAQEAELDRLTARISRARSELAALRQEARRLSDTISGYELSHETVDALRDAWVARQDAERGRDRALRALERAQVARGSLASQLRQARHELAALRQQQPASPHHALLTALQAELRRDRHGLRQARDELEGVAQLMDHLPATSAAEAAARSSLLDALRTLVEGSERAVDRRAALLKAATEGDDPRSPPGGAAG